MLYSLELERDFLSGLIKNPSIFYEIDGRITNETFSDDFHQIVYSIIKQMVLANEPLEKTLLAQKITNLGKTKNGEIPTFDYIDNLFYTAPNSKGTLALAQELVKLKVLREISLSAKDIHNYVKGNKEKGISEIIAECDAIYHDKISCLFQTETEPKDLFEGLEEYIETIGNEQKQDGINCPFPLQQQLFGNYFNGELYFYCARAKSRKSTYLAYTNLLCCNDKKEKTKGLILDTELNTQLVQRRLLSTLSGISEFFIRTGIWRKNKEMTEKIRAAWPIVKEYIGSIDHFYVGAKDIDEIIAIARRWYYKNIPRDGSIKGMITLDYVKLTEELGAIKYNKYKDYQIVGQKVDKLKRLAEELQVPILTAGQTNRLNEERKDASKRVDSGSAVGLSDAINALSSSVFLFNRMTLDESAEAKTEYNIDATHKLVPLYCRNLGPLGAEQERVRIIRDKKTYYVDNFIYYNVELFGVKEVDTLYNLERSKKEHYDIEGEIAEDSNSSI